MDSECCGALFWDELLLGFTTPSISVGCWCMTGLGTAGFMSQGLGFRDFRLGVDDLLNDSNFIVTLLFSVPDFGARLF